MKDSNQVKKLIEKFEDLISKQTELTTEMKNLKIEVEAIRPVELAQMSASLDSEETLSNSPETEHAEISPSAPQADQITAAASKSPKSKNKPQPSLKTVLPKKVEIDLEKFIGENLINKIGILILILGLAIGTKYSIEHDLISPVARIILAYLIGLGLLGVGFKLKRKYTNYSAVLVSGATASLYFITYFAYNFYGLIPQFIAFGLMVMITGFTIFTALSYDKQIIGLLGFVGAYGVPFLLSDGSGNVLILFIYMAIINIGILILAFKKDWKRLYYSAFGLTWLIYLGWYFSTGGTSYHQVLALVFLTIFFLIFYTIFLAYQVLKQTKFRPLDIFMLITNSVIFYGMGYITIYNHSDSNFALSGFTLLNAGLHFGVTRLIKSQNLKPLHNFITGLFLVFITLTIPVQLDGAWVTLGWALEAVILFGIGRLKHNYIYEKLDYALIMVSFVSLLEDCANYDYSQTIFLNLHFSVSLISTAALGFIYFLKTQSRFDSPLKPDNPILRVSNVLLPIILILTSYLTFFMEIWAYWEQAVEIGSGREKVKIVWLISYSLCFLAGLSVLNFRKLRSKTLFSGTFGFSILGFAIFLTTNLILLEELRADDLIGNSSVYLFTRYLALFSLGILLRAFYQHKWQPNLTTENLDKPINYLFHLTILVTASNEVIHWFNMLNSSESYKFGLTILWGAYALLLISLGIRSRKKYLRVAAIALLALTMLKLFLYDLADLGTVAKTIAFIALGLFLLIISFLYNKYRERLSKDF